jgi:hypothetical protein
MKPENKHTQAIHVQSHDWAAENQQLRKELLAREKRIEELEAMASYLNNQLSEKIDQINDMMQKMISVMTTNGDATLLDSLRQSVVAEIRAEFEQREQKLKESYAHEREKLTSDFNARLAIQQSEVNRLKSINDKIELHYLTKYLREILRTKFEGNETTKSGYKCSHCQLGQW